MTLAAWHCTSTRTKWISLKIWRDTSTCTYKQTHLHYYHKHILVVGLRSSFHSFSHVTLFHLPTCHVSITSWTIISQLTTPTPLYSDYLLHCVIYPTMCTGWGSTLPSSRVWRCGCSEETYWGSCQCQLYKWGCCYAFNTVVKNKTTCYYAYWTIP